MRAAALLGLLVTGACSPTASRSASPVWTEQATRDYRDGEHKWANPWGDWLDAAGTPLGAKPFATAPFERDPDLAPIRLDVTELVRRFGADFRINSVDGIARFAARESGPDGPALEVTTGSGTRRLTAVADTEINQFSIRPAGDKPDMSTKSGMLIRFDQGPDSGITRATLVLKPVKIYGRGGRLLVFRPAVLDAPATLSAGASFAPGLPEQIRPDAAARALLPGDVSEAVRSGPGRVLLSLDAAEIKRPDNATLKGGILVSAFEREQLAALSDIRPLPGASTSAFVTVLLRLDPGFKGLGGKLPGLTNTGQSDRSREDCIVDGQPKKVGGWGGRGANGCRWSARSHFHLLRSGEVAGGTYFYALQPKNANGVVQPWSLTMPRGRWFAYVQWVRLNTPGKADGQIAYWLIDRPSAENGKLVQSAGGIRWRDTADPKSAINELWINVYCGGRDCGPAPWPRSEVWLKRVTVTTGLPDMAAIQRELDSLNRTP